MCHYYLLQPLIPWDSYSTTYKRQIWQQTSSIQVYFLSMTLHHIDHIISIIHGHPFFSSTNHRRDIHTNVPWVHHSSESAFSMCVGLLMKTRGRGHTQREILPSSKDPKLTLFPSKRFELHACVCVRLLWAFLTPGGKPTPSALGYHLLKGDI